MATKVELKKNSLIITLPLQKPKISKSGKTLVVASSHGNFISDVELKGERVAVVANAYIFRNEEEEEDEQE